MNRCKYNAESFQENLSLLADPLVEDSLKLKDSNRKDIKVTDNIRRQFLSKCISHLWYNTDFSSQDEKDEAIELIQEFQDDWLDEAIKLDDTGIKTAITNTPVTSEDAIYQDYTSSVLEKEDSYKENKQRFTKAYLTKYFGKCKRASNYCVKESSKLIVNGFYLSPDYDSNGNITSTHIIFGDDAINQSIHKQQELLYSNIYNYLKGRFINNPEKLKNLPETLYTEQGIYRGSFEKLNELFDDIFNEESFDDITLDNLFDSYESSEGFGKMFVKSQIDAYNSWVILKNFDTVLTNLLGNSVYINNAYTQFASLPSSLPNSQADQYKYSIRRAKASNMNTTWRTNEDINIEDEINNTAQLLITNVDLIGTDRKVKFNEFGYIISSLKELPFNIDYSDQQINQPLNLDIGFTEKTKNLLGGKTIYEAITSIKESAKDYIPAIFELFSKDYIYKNILVNKNQYLIDTQQKNLIKSIYEGLFNPNNKTSLMYANNEAGYINADYIHTITEVADAIYKTRYGQYFNDADNNTYFRNMYDQTINNEYRNLENTILLTNTKQINNWEEFKNKYNIKAIEKDGKLQSITYELIPLLDKPGITITIPNSGSITWEISKELAAKGITVEANILPAVKDILGIDLLNNKELLDDYKILTGVNYWSQLLTIVSKVIKNKYVSNEKLVDEDGNSLTDISKINTILETLYPKEQYRPKYNKLLREIYLTDGSMFYNLEQLAKAEAQYKGKLTAAQIKDGNGNYTPNTTLSRLLGSVLEQFTLQCRKEDSIVKHFNILRPGILKGIYQAKEYKSKFSDTSINHLQFNPGEVEEAEILYDFLNGLKPAINSKSPVGDGVVAFLPSDNSDKSYIGRITIDLAATPINNLGIDVGNNTTLFDIIKNTQYKNPDSVSQLNNVLYALIKKSLGTYYANVETNIDSLWKRVNEAFREYIDPNGEHPFKDIEIKYQESKFDAINKFYLANSDRYKSPLQIINNAIRQYNQNHLDDIIAPTEHSTFEVDKSSKLLLPNINALWLNKVLNDAQETSQLFNRQDIEIIKDLFNDGFNVPNVPIITIKSKEGSVNVYNVNDLYRYASKILTDDDILNKSTDEIVDILTTYPDTTVKLNQQISTYNKLNFLFTQEWTIATVGAHFNHPSKVKTIKINGETKKINTNVFRTIPLSDFEEINIRKNGGNISVVNTKKTITLAQLFRKSGYNVEDFKKLAHQKRFGDAAINTYLDQVNAIIKADDVSRFLAQTKRNVQYTAQMHPFSLNSLQGISSVSNVTIITDNNTEVNTVSGDVVVVPTSDGATYVNPFQAYWENGSLSEKVGINKKQFIHFYNQITGTGGIVKTAGFAITNELMRLGIFDRVMMKEMTSGIWRDPDGNPITNKDITQRYDSTDDNKKEISYENYIDVRGNVYIKDSAGIYHKFVKLQYNPEDDTYSRIIQDIDSNYNTTTDLKPDPEFDHKRVNSNYTLWEALGGYKCYELKPNTDKLSGSEYSIWKVAEIANQTGILLNGVSSGNVYSQKDVYQFMKHSDVHYNPTEGAVKHGIANKENINPYLRGEVSVDNYKPNYMHIRMNQSGIQLDKEHNADQEDLSIFTQVISACAARGYTFEQAQNLYDTLATLAQNAVAPYIDSFNAYLENPDQNKEVFIDTISKLIAKSLMTQDNESSVLQYITSNLINLAKKGEQIKFKDNLPFSDNSIYNKLLSIISVSLTKGAIKIKMPGLLAVLCPSKDRIKTYNGKMLDQYSEQELQELQDNYDDVPVWHDGDFHNEESDIELCKTYKIYPKEVLGFSITSALNNAGIKYYVKDNVVNTEVESPRQRLVLKTFLQNNANNIEKVCENVLVGKNLAPYNVTFYAETNGVRKRFTLYDCDVVLNRFNKHKGDEDYPSDADLQNVLNVLDPNSTDQNIIINGEQWVVDKSSIKIDEYECVIPKVFATNFGLDYNSKLSDILEDEDYFTKKLLKQITQPTIDNNYFSVGFTKLKGDPFYVLDRSKVQKSDNFYPIDIATEVDDKGNVNVLNSKYDIDFTFSKNQNDLDNDENLKQDEVWMYVDNRGNTHRVIVTDNLQYYIDNTESNGVVVSTMADDFVKTQLETSKNKRVSNIYKAIKYLGNGNINSGYNIIREALKDPKHTDFNKLLGTNEVLRYIQDIGKEIWNSFNQSLKLVAARIPAQSMQSFMAMKIVGFVDSDVNTAYVSTLQTYLQGSDYDIDAVSLSMFAFDQNGKFVKWSDLFDMSSMDMLKASMTLPLPTGKYFTENDIKYDENGVNLIDYVATNANDLDKPIIILGDNKLRIRLSSPKNLIMYGELIHKLTSNSFTIIDDSINRHLAKWLLPKVNKYNAYLQNIKNSKQRIDAIKNNIETQIYDIILNPKNQIEAQVSVDSATKPFKDLAAQSPRAEDSNRSTPLKFTSNIHAISDNSVGKQGIGIAAVGMKSYFAATQYFNWVVKHGTPEQKENLKFNVQIGGKVYTQLSNVEGLENSENWNYIDFAVYLSAILSLSTDNAKELALNKLNCDNNTMGMWLYGLTIGMTPKDIYSIMTSDIAFEIAKLGRSNIFIDQNGMSINKVIKFIENGPQISSNIAWNRILHEFNTSVVEANSKRSRGEEIFTPDSLDKLYKLQDKVKLDSKLQKEDKQLILNTIDSVLTYIRVKSKLQNTISKEVFEDFKTLYKGADEMKTLGQILHLNQGLYTSDLDTLKIISRIENIITDRAHAIDYKGNTEKFNLHRFLYNQEYQKLIIEKYNDVKVSFNILDLITKVPHYYEYLKILDLQDNMYSVISSKYRTIKTLGRIIINKSGAYSQSDKEAIYKRIKQYADNQILQNWFLESNAFDSNGIQITIPKGAQYFLTTTDKLTLNPIEQNTQYTDVFGKKYTVGVFDGMKINLGTADGRATFKLWMESQVIPNLKRGNNGIQTADGKYDTVPLSPLLNNKFIQSLSPTVYTKTPMNTVITGYCANINMSPQTDLDIEIFQSYKNAFNKLDTYGEYSMYHSGLAKYKISDLLFLYNLVTYQNNLGENTLTKIFEDKYDSPLIHNYMQYINEFDRTRDFVLDVHSTDFNNPEILAQLLPKANKNNTNLNQFISINNITGEVQVLTKNQDRDSEEKFDVRPVLNNSYYPTTDSQKNTIDINASDISDENKTAIIPIRKGDKIVGEENIDIDSISVDHMNGTILQISVNGQKVEIEDKYKAHFKHIPTKQVITGEGNYITKYDTDQLIDDIITLISKEC